MMSRNLTGWMCDIMDDIGNAAINARVRAQVGALCARHPVYSP